MIKIQVPAENVEIGHDYNILVEWIEHYDIDIRNVDYITVDIVEFTFADYDQAMLFKLAWA